MRSRTLSVMSATLTTNTLKPKMIAFEASACFLQGALMRERGCKANWYNKDGVKVGKGLGDLNPSEGALKSVETD